MIQDTNFEYKKEYLNMILDENIAPTGAMSSGPLVADVIQNPKFAIYNVISKERLDFETIEKRKEFLKNNKDWKELIEV